VPAPIFIASPGTAAAGAENIAVISTITTSQRIFFTLSVIFIVILGP
jgi:hypothetical protein